MTEKTKKDIELVFVPAGTDASLLPTGGKEILGELKVKLEEFLSWLTGFKVDSIEVWVSGTIETNGVLKIFVSAKGEGGMKITFKPEGKTESTE